MSRILGIDPGSRITGFGIVQVHAGKAHYVASGIIKCQAQAVADRLLEVFQGMEQVIRSYQPSTVAIESVFVSRNVASALKLGQARGVAMVAAAAQQLPISEYSARQIKQAVVGYGNAKKQQVQHMVAAILNLSALPTTDAADALAVALCHLQSGSGLLPFGQTGLAYSKGRIG